ncbi:hypothetical protein [Oxynema aestuarii]|uniref:Glycosyltransferase RgtA/B/C/D-like domain-containing protein n=1 Tax=Oxynema aestuarii AP17 TaxID=2064643 RepID=A0A6H1TT97_9CYAN|nr:hypothetical protein [Oxynema aestuarii]QIZ69367.1 hypothetical protein HCG48_01185 [Oxynema aestuarii AP17]
MHKVIELWNKFIERYGWFGLLRLIFYPLTTLVTTPVRLLQTLWACLILADGKWHSYNRFTAKHGINSLFYWTRALNLYRYGRWGNSPYLGLGNYDLSRCFHYSLLSLYAYWVASPVFLLVCMFGWLFSHLIWLQDISSTWVLLVIGLAAISTTFYSNTFGLQNYNAAGWLFFPLGLYALLTQKWILAGTAWLAASFGSFTVVFIAGILSLVAAISICNIYPLLALLPALLKLCTHFLPSIDSGNFRNILFSVAKAIGMIDKKVKYKRTSSRKLGITHLYFLLIYSQFVLVFYVLKQDIPALFLSGVIFFLINSTFVRFADVQSIYMLIFSLATATTIQNPMPLLLLSYWVLASPLPLFTGLISQENFDVVPKLAPFSIQPFIEGMKAFFSPVSQGERVFMAFEDPKNTYENVFDGYRTLLELPLYVAATKNIHFMPDWWGVFELNYEGAPDFWGRTVELVQKNIKCWNADYVVIYQDAGTELEEKWRDAGFTVLSCFSWRDYEEHLRGEKPYSGETPVWWLVKKPMD